MTGSIRDEAICLVADAKKSRWTVRQDHDNYASGSTSAGSQQQYPPSTTSPEDLLSKADTTTQQATALEEAPNVPEHSSVTYTLLESPGLGDKSGKLQRAQRHVIYDNDYKIGLKVLDSIEDKFRKSIRKFLLIYLLSCLAWLIFIYSIVKYFDGPPEAFFALTLMPLACSVVVPMVAIPDAWPMYFYKPPVVGTV